MRSQACLVVPNGARAWSANRALSRPHPATIAPTLIAGVSASPNSTPRTSPNSALVLPSHIWSRAANTWFRFQSIHDENEFELQVRGYRLFRFVHQKWILRGLASKVRNAGSAVNYHQQSRYALRDSNKGADGS